MALMVLIIFIMLYIYLKYPYIFDFKPTSISCKFIKLSRESGVEPINYANFIIYDDTKSIIIPTELNISPSLAYGDGKNPKAKSATDLEDIVLVETVPGVLNDKSKIPFVEYDLGSLKKVSNVTIINRKLTTGNASQKVNERLNGTLLQLLDVNRAQVFEKKLESILDIYSINIS